MKTSKILTLAKPLLSYDEPSYICMAINKVADSVDHELRVCDIIEDRLDPWATAANWLAAEMTGARTWSHRHTNIRHKWIKEQGAQAIQAWRHAWLDQLIAEFKAKGD